MHATDADEMTPQQRLEVMAETLASAFLRLRAGEFSAAGPGERGNSPAHDAQPQPRANEGKRGETRADRGRLGRPGTKAPGLSPPQRVEVTGTQGEVPWTTQVTGLP